MKNESHRRGKRLVQAWVDAELVEKALALSGKTASATLLEAMTLFTKKNRTELEMAQERYESIILEATRLKARIDEMTNNNLTEVRKEILKEIVPKNKQIKRELSEKERNEIWEAKIKPLLKRKISEVGFEQVIKDERMLDNFSKGLSISTGELKEKISTEWGVV